MLVGANPRDVIVNFWRATVLTDGATRYPLDKPHKSFGVVRFLSSGLS